MESIAESLTPKQKARLHKVADLMLEIYNTLARMLYLEPEWIEPGPHDLTALMPLYESLNLDPSIIYLYHILPYVNAPDDSRTDFLMGSSFADFRKEDDVRQSRDPMYADDQREMMRPWMTPLSMLGNHESVILYDVRRHVVGIFDQIYGGSSDRNLYGGVVFKTTNESGEDLYFTCRDGVETPCDASEWDRQGSREDADSDEDEEDEEEEQEETEDEGYETDEDREEEDDDEDENIWDEMDARPARRVLKDIIRWYRELLETPGGGERSEEEWDHDLVKPLYVKHGWPGEDFDADAFLVDQARAVAARVAERRAPEPFPEICDLRARVAEREEKLASVMPERQKRIAKARAPDEEWRVRWEIWLDELIIREFRSRMERLREQLGPDGEARILRELPWRELKEIQSELEYRKRKLTTLKQEQSGQSPQDQVRIRWVEKETAVYERAYSASLADAERLCPDGSLSAVDSPIENLRGFSDKARIDTLTARIEDSEREVADVRDWMAQLPEGADGARSLAQKYLDSMEYCIKDRKGERQRYAEALEMSVGEKSS